MIYEKWSGLRQAEGLAGLLGKALLLVAFCYGVLAFGATREINADRFTVLLYVAVSFWMVELLLRARFIRIPLYASSLALGLLALGWLQVLAGFDLDGAFDSSLAVIPFWENISIYLSPLDAQLVLNKMLRDGALLMAFLMLIETLRDLVYRWFFIRTLAALCIVMVGIAFLQGIVGGPFQLMSEDGTLPLSFGVYRYWGNAGAFLNLTWPAIVACAMVASRKSSRSREGVSPVFLFWALAGVTAVIGCFENRSKAGNALAVIGIGLLALLVWRLWRRQRGATLSRSKFFLLVGGCGFLLAICGFLLPWKVWDTLFSSGLENESRWRAYGFFAQEIPKIGWCGYGPGTFRLVSMDNVPPGDSLHDVAYWVAHEDYLQTIIEWGWVGAIAWLLLMAGGLVGLIRKFWRTSTPPPNEGRMIDLGWRIVELPAFAEVPRGEAFYAAAGITAVTLTALHSAVDFPMQIMSLQAIFLFWLALGYSPTPAEKRQGSR